MEHEVEGEWSWGKMKLRENEVEGEWSWGRIKLMEYGVEGEWSWRSMKLRGNEVEGEWSWGRMKLREFEVEGVGDTESVPGDSRCWECCKCWDGWIRMCGVGWTNFLLGMRNAADINGAISPYFICTVCSEQIISPCCPCSSLWMWSFLSRYVLLNYSFSIFVIDVSSVIIRFDTFPWCIIIVGIFCFYDIGFAYYSGNIIDTSSLLKPLSYPTHNEMW